jgi:hypothetical protein
MEADGNAILEEEGKKKRDHRERLRELLEGIRVRVEVDRIDGGRGS